MNNFIMLRNKTNQITIRTTTITIIVLLYNRKWTKVSYPLPRLFIRINVKPLFVKCL